MKPTPAIDNSAKKSHETFEAGQKLEALREKRAQQDQEKWQKWQEEREAERERMEIDKKRREEQRERRKREQKEVEQQLKLFEEQRREREEEEARRMEEYERKRQAEDQNQASPYRVTSMINAVSLAAMKARQGNSHVKSKKDVIAERLPPLDISDDTPTEELKKMVELLRGKLKTVRGEIFDLMQKTEKQDYFINELDQRIQDMNKDSAKPKPVLMIGSGTVVNHPVQPNRWRGIFQNCQSHERQRLRISSEGCILYPQAQEPFSRSQHWCKSAYESAAGKSGS